jgi:hypothetical protein
MSSAKALVTALKTTKPRIKLVNGTWKCWGYVKRGAGEAWDYGMSPSDAYYSWRLLAL